MKVGAPIADLLRQRLAAVCAPDIMHLQAVDIYRGPAPPAPVAAIMCEIAVGEDLPPFTLIHRRLHTLLPEIATAPGAPVLPGTSTALALATELASLTAAVLSRVLRLKLASGAQSRPDGTAVGWFEYFLEEPAIGALRIALIALGSAISGTDSRDALQAMNARLEKRSKAIRPSFQTLFKIEAARKREIPFLRIAGSWAIWQFGWGVNSLHFWTTSSDADGLVGNSLTHDKDGTKKLLVQLGLPTPAWARLAPDNDVAQAAEAIGWPCVVKPVVGGAGRGVTADIRSRPVLERAAALARQFSADILIEAHQSGDDHRLMIVDGRLAAAIRRDPPTIVGDGFSTVRELIGALNHARSQSTADIVKYYPVKEDAALEMTLASQNLGLADIPDRDRRIALRTNSNISTGGTATDVTALIHPQIRRMAEQLAAAAGLRTAGLDYITTDISRSHDEVGGAFIETNTTAGIDVILLAGIDADQLGTALLGARPGRIPVTLLLAPADARGLIGETIAQNVPRGVAVAAGDGGRIGPFVLPGAMRDPVSLVEALLRYPSVESLIILWTFDELYRFGLPGDRVDTLILLGTAPDPDWDKLLRERSIRVIAIKDAVSAIEALSLNPIATPA